MANATRQKLSKVDLDNFFETGYFSVPSKVRSRLMPTVIEEYNRLTEHPDYKTIFLMDDPRYTGEDGTPDVGYMPRDPSKKDKKFITHFIPQLIAEVNNRGFDWACCPNLVSAICQIQAEALMVAADVVELLQKHCFPDDKFYFGQSLEEIFRAGQNCTVTRLLNYLPDSNKQEKGTAAPHWDRNFLTCHFGSSHPGFYIMRDKKITFLDDMDPERIITFLGSKLWWATNRNNDFGGLAHGVLEDESAERSQNSRIAAITFNHMWMPPEERSRMCAMLDDHREQLAAEFRIIRDQMRLVKPKEGEPVPVAA